MKNPPLKPPHRDGFGLSYLKPVWGVASVWIVDWKTGESFYGPQSKIIRRGHWRYYPLSTKAEKAKKQNRLWIPVTAYAAELQEKFNLGGMDPLYRYHRKTDLIRSLSPVTDALHGLIWGAAFNGDNVKGSFHSIRAWYLVKDTNLNRHYVYSRTAMFGEKRVFDTLRLCRGEIQKLMDTVGNEYDEKDYMELVGLVAWTAYGEIQMKSIHKKFHKLSRERAFHIDEQSGEIKRVATPWEKKMFTLTFQGERGTGLHSALTKNYGGDPKRFTAALHRLPRSERRIAWDQFKEAIRQMESVLQQKRRARK